jgi:Ca2+/Na+ antiporter
MNSGNGGRKWQMYGENVFKIVQMILVVLSAFSTVFSIYGFLIGQNVISRILIIATLFFILLFVILSVRKIVSEQEEKTQVIATELHTYCHSLRDNKYKLDNLVKDHYNNEALWSLLRSFSENVTNEICRLFSVLYARECNANIKLIDMAVWDNSKLKNKKEKENVEISMVLRCEKSHRRRKDLPLHKIKDHTGYYEIFINGRADYALLNITKYKKDNTTYKDANDNHVGQYYNNMLIVPIRIKNHILDSAKPDCNENNLFGFITLDFLKSSGISENDIKVGLDYLKTFADSSYLLFDAIRVKIFEEKPKTDRVQTKV